MPRHMRLASAVAFVVAAAMCFAMPALGTGDGLSFLAAWANEDEIGPHVESIAATADGSIVVADRKRDRVVRFTYEHAHAGSFPATDPRGIAVIPGGYLIAEADRVRRTDVDGTTLATYAADDPYGVALAGDTVLIADAADGRILRYRLDGASLPAWEAKLIAPRGLAVGPDGTVYAADAGRWRIETFSADGQDSGGWWVPDPHGVAVGPDGVVYVATNVAQRLKWFSSTGAYAGSLGDFGGPRGVAVDCRGTVTVADSSRHRLQSYGDPASPAPPCETPAPPPPRRAERPPPAPAIEQPVLGSTAAVVPVSGSVFIGEGARRRLLTARSIVPVETHIDATEGEVELTFETAPQDTAAYGEFQHGVFYDGAFTVHQGTGDSLVELRLTGEAPDSAGTARASRAAKRRRVWGSAKGEFRTTGRHGAATVRGTRWLVEDRPSGTFIKVTEGSVLAEAFARDKSRVLHAPESFLARPACVSRRSFRIRLRIPVGTSVRSARVTVNGKRVPVSAGARLTAPVDLRGMPAGAVKVRIRIVTTRGSVLTGTRTYLTCTGARSQPRALPGL